MNSSTGLVSVTAGGNDVGFADVMQDCVLSGEATCLSSIGSAVSQMQNSLPSGLSSLYGSIRSRAPQAHVVVLGYPRFYQLSGSCIAGLSEKERAAINNASDVLNGVIAKQAADAGFTFSSVVDEFTGHELCSGDAWLHSVSIPVYNSYHPKAHAASPAVTFRPSARPRRTRTTEAQKVRRAAGDRPGRPPHCCHGAVRRGPTRCLAGAGSER